MTNYLQGREWFELNFKIVQSKLSICAGQHHEVFQSDKNSFHLPPAVRYLSVQCSFGSWVGTFELVAWPLRSFHPWPACFCWLFFLYLFLEAAPKIKRERKALSKWTGVAWTWEPPKTKQPKKIDSTDVPRPTANSVARSTASWPGATKEKKTLFFSSSKKSKLSYFRMFDGQPPPTRWDRCKLRLFDKWFWLVFPIFELQ